MSAEVLTIAPASTGRRRAELEDAVERAIALLNALDGDEDLEPEEDAEHDGREPEEDLDTSDYEGSLCGITFGAANVCDDDREGTSPPFTMDQRELERA